MGGNMPRTKGAKNKQKTGIADDPMLPDKSLFRVDEVAAYFKITRRTVYLWIEHGLLGAEKYRGIIRVPRVAILECRNNARLNPMAGR
jgi:excisionase family DNA binding protein